MRQPIAVEAGLDAQGRLRPEAFSWQGQRLRVSAHGRRWEQGGECRFLVQVAGLGTFDLAFSETRGAWSLVRVPSDFGPKTARPA